MKTRLGFWYSLAYAFVNFSEASVTLATAGLYSPAWVMTFTAWHMKRVCLRRIRENFIGELRRAFPLLSPDDLDENEHCCEWILQQDRKRLHTFLDILSAAVARVGGAK